MAEFGQQDRKRLSARNAKTSPANSTILGAANPGWSILPCVDKSPKIEGAEYQTSIFARPKNSPSRGASRPKHSPINTRVLVFAQDA
jgi:hypothetical protein